MHIHQVITVNGIPHTIEVREPLGAGGGVYYVSVDNYHVGQIVNTLHGWMAYIRSEYLYSDDIGAILDSISQP